jgi:glycosyltransferase involved in cell wall biosynthesis
MIQEFLSELSLQDKLIGGVLAFLMFIVLLIQYIMLYRLSRKKSEISDVKQAVSVVITAQNDGVFLEKYLQRFLTQDYPDFEVIVVDDCSYDDTQTILAIYQQKYPQLRTSTIRPDSKFNHSRKLALNIGIKAAKNDIVIFSEANCFPVSEHWIDHIQSAFKPGIDVVLAYSNYINKKSFLGTFLIYDRFIRVVRSLAFALKNKPYKGDGANMAYRKSAYLDNNCFAGSSQIDVGYDSLPVLRILKKKNVDVVLHQDSHVLVDYLNIKKEWKHYKRNYYLSRFFYKRLRKMNIDFLPCLRCLVWAVFIVFIVLSEHFLLVLIMGLMYQIMTLIYKKILVNVLKEKKIFVYSLYSDLVIGVLSFVQYLKARSTWFYGTTFKFIR